MIIYNSTKVYPYVYICIHKITREFYIGYREKNKIPSDKDFPKYKTSSANIKNNFDEYEWTIIAEFFQGDDAYDFEQYTIFQNWNNPLLLNKNCQYGKSRFKSPKSMSAETKEKISKAHTGNPKSPAHKVALKLAKQTISDETRSRISKAHVGKPAHNKGKPMADAQKLKLSVIQKGIPKPYMSALLTGKTQSADTKLKKSKALAGKPWSDARRDAYLLKYNKTAK